MRTAPSILFAALMGLSVSAFAAEFNDECSWGLANDKHVKTECKVNLTREDGKTYCFSNDRALEAFMKDPTTNMKKAEETFGRS
jgi:YHS domain-containing protein